LWASLTESEVNSTTSKLGKAAQSLCAMSGSTFHLNHREWNSLFHQTVERHGKLTGYVSSHDKYPHPISTPGRANARLDGWTVGGELLQQPIRAEFGTDKRPFSSFKR